MCSTGEAPVLLLILLSPSVGSLQATWHLLSKYPSGERVYHKLTLKWHFHPLSHLICTTALEGRSRLVHFSVEETEKQRSEETCRGSLSLTGIQIQAVWCQNRYLYPPCPVVYGVSLNELMSEWMGEFK